LWVAIDLERLLKFCNEFGCVVHVEWLLLCYCIRRIKRRCHIVCIPDSLLDVEESPLAIVDIRLPSLFVQHT
jgi:hypothetical protein